MCKGGLRAKGSAMMIPHTSGRMVPQGVVESLCEACGGLGWTAPTEIQKEAIPAALEGRDVIGLAETVGTTRVLWWGLRKALLSKEGREYGGDRRQGGLVPAAWI
jgi:hypothetical protein